MNVFLPSEDCVSVIYLYRHCYRCRDFYCCCCCCCHCCRYPRCQLLLLLCLLLLSISLNGNLSKTMFRRSVWFILADMGPCPTLSRFPGGSSPTLHKFPANPPTCQYTEHTFHFISFQFHSIPLLLFGLLWFGWISHCFLFFSFASMDFLHFILFRLLFCMMFSIYLNIGNLNCKSMQLPVARDKCEWETLN